MLITVRGRVAMDPTAVPLAASMQTGREDCFAQVLQQAVDGDAPTRVDDRNPEPEPVEEQAPEPENEREPSPAPEAAEAPPDPTANALAADPTQPGPTSTPAPADVHEAIRRGEPERQATAGKGADSPRTSKHTIEPLVAAVVLHTAQGQTPVAPFVPGQRGVTAVGGVSGAATPTRGTELPRGAMPLRAPAPAATLRSAAPPTAELFEQARESVFQQILMKLDRDGGEMRLRLQPPELGQLDLRLVVEDGNRLTLTIAADRDDTAQLLQRHLDELKHTLQPAGLEISGASVQTRSEFARDHGGAFGQEPRHAFDGTDDEPPTTADRRRLGYVSATGLDFWA